MNKSQIGQADKEYLRRPPFDWRVYRRSVVHFVIDLVLLVVVALVGWLFVWGCIFGFEHFPIGEKAWADIVSASAWPVCCFVCVFLFRQPLLRILDMLPGFIARSRYMGQGEIIWNITQDGKTLSGRKSESGDTSAAKNDWQKATDAVFEMIEAEYGVTITRNAVLNDSRFVFDGAFNIGETAYIVEVKIYEKLSAIGNDVIQQVKSFYNKLDPDHKSKLKVLLVIVTSDSVRNWNLSIRRIKNKLSIDSIVRIVSLDQIKNS